MAVRTSEVGERLLAAARANPDDTVALQLYADWLQEHGDWRGEALGLSARLRGELSEAEHEPLQRRLDALCIDERRLDGLAREHRRARRSSP
jgi:uncharacterized protein (TIGR02996 family)